jgi:hypothetical protein
VSSCGQYFYCFYSYCLKIFIQNSVTLFASTKLQLGPGPASQVDRLSEMKVPGEGQEVYLNCTWTFIMIDAIFLDDYRQRYPLEPLTVLQPKDYFIQILNFFSNIKVT